MRTISLALRWAYLGVLGVAVSAALVTVLALARPAFAEALPPCIDRPPLAGPLPSSTKPVGTPEQLGGKCVSVIEANTLGGAIAFWCKQTAPKPPKLYLYAVEWKAVTPEMMADFSKLGLPGDNRARIAAMTTKYQTKSVMDMCDVWGPARERINAARP